MTRTANLALLISVLLPALCAAQCQLGGNNLLPPTDTSCNNNCVVVNPGPGPAFLRSYSPTIQVSGGTAPYAVALNASAGALPNGLTLSFNSNTNRVSLSGRATHVGTFNFSICVNDSASCINTCRAYSLAVTCGNMVWNPTGVEQFQLNALINPVTFGVNWNTAAQVQNSLEPWGGTPNMTFAATAGALPSGLNFYPVTTNGKTYQLYLNGTPTQAGPFSWTFTATDANGCTGVNAYTTRVCASAVNLIPSTGALPDGRVGTPYSQQLTGSGGLPPYTFTLVNGPLPPGLAFNNVTGVISGTPTTPGLYPITVSVSDTIGCLRERDYDIDIQCPALPITPATLPNADTTNPYSQQLTASGGAAPYSFQLNGGFLPNGITLSNSGLLSTQGNNRPALTGLFRFTVEVTDNNNCVYDQQYQLVVVCGAINFTPVASALPNGTIGTAYTTTITAAGASNAFDWRIVTGAGQLPPSFALSNFQDTTVAIASANPLYSGTYTFTLQATDKALPFCSSTKVYSITVVCVGGQAITIVPQTPAAAQLSVPYALNFTASSATGTSFNFTGGQTTNLGLAFATPSDPSFYIQLAGVPNTAGSTDAFVNALDTATGCNGRLNFRETVCDPAQLSLPTATVTWSTATLGLYTGAINNTVSTAGAYQLSVATTAPFPIRISQVGTTNSYAISGTPLTAGTFTATITATYISSSSPATTVGCTATTQLTIVVSCTSFSVSPTNAPQGTLDNNYFVTFTANAGSVLPVASASLSGSLPPGLSLNASTATVSGTPTTIGQYNYNITLTDSAGCTGVRTYTQNVVCPTVSLNGNQPPTGTQGVTYSYTFIPSRTAGLSAMTVNTGALPTGLSFTGGRLSGTPSAAGTYTFSVIGTDLSGCNSTAASFTIRICASATINITALPQYNAGSAYSLALGMNGFTAPLTWGAGGLPSFLSLNQFTGVLSGVAPTPGPVGHPFAVTITVLDATACQASFSFSLSPPCPALSSAVSSLPKACKNAYAVNLNGTLVNAGQRAPFRWSVSNATSSWAALSADGQLSGTVPSPRPQTAESVTVSVLDQNSCPNTFVYQLPYGCKSKGLSGGAIAGIVIGCIAGVAIIGGVIFFVLRSKSD